MFWIRLLKCTSMDGWVWSINPVGITANKTITLLEIYFFY